ncbi:MAG: PhnB protein [Candidatus Eremiobacteraeota bacterium]|nr:PhnB protein [Candidatus Eremiobacteraeota bacterium]
MQYMLLIYNQTSERVPSEAEFGTVRAEYGTYTEDIRKRGAMVDGSALALPTSATTVRVREGNRVVTDGPFAETKEWLAGYYVIEAASLDHALDAAAACPGAKYGSVEIRPLVDMS